MGFRDLGNMEGYHGQQMRFDCPITLPVFGGYCCHLLGRSSFRAGGVCDEVLGEPKHNFIAGIQR